MSFISHFTKFYSKLGVYDQSLRLADEQPPSVLLSNSLLPSFFFGISLDTVLFPGGKEEKDKKVHFL